MHFRLRPCVSAINAYSSRFYCTDIPRRLPCDWDKDLSSGKLIVKVSLNCVLWYVCPFWVPCSPTQKLPACFLSNISFVLAKWVIECKCCSAAPALFPFPSLTTVALTQIKNSNPLSHSSLPTWTLVALKPVPVSVKNGWSRSLLFVSDCCAILSVTILQISRIKEMNIELRKVVNNFQGLQDPRNVS